MIYTTKSNYKVVFANSNYGRTGNISVPTVGMAFETQQLQLFRLINSIAIVTNLRLDH